jgi:hypothetical protein
MRKNPSMIPLMTLSLPNASSASSTAISWGRAGDGKVIILSDSDEENEEAHEEKSTDVEDVATSTAVNSVSTTSADDIGTLAEKSSNAAASPADADNDPKVEPNDSSDGLALGLKVEKGNGGRDEVDAP